MKKIIFFLGIFAFLFAISCSEDSLFENPSTEDYHFIKGKVTDLATDQPIAGIEITAMDCTTAAGQEGCDYEVYGQITTKEDGLFSIDYYGNDCLKLKVISPLMRTFDENGIVRYVLEYPEFVVDGKTYTTNEEPVAVPNGDADYIYIEMVRRVVD